MRMPRKGCATGRRGCNLYRILYRILCSACRVAGARLGAVPHENPLLVPNDALAPGDFGRRRRRGHFRPLERQRALIDALQVVLDIEIIVAVLGVEERLDTIEPGASSARRIVDMPIAANRETGLIDIAHRGQHLGRDGEEAAHAIVDVGIGNAASRGVDCQRSVAHERHGRAALLVPKPEVEMTEMRIAARRDRSKIELVPSAFLEDHVVVDLEQKIEIDAPADIEDGVALPADGAALVADDVAIDAQPHAQERLDRAVARAVIGNDEQPAMRGVARRRPGFEAFAQVIAAVIGGHRENERFRHGALAGRLRLIRMVEERFNRSASRMRVWCSSSSLPSCSASLLGWPLTRSACFSALQVLSQKWTVTVSRRMAPSEKLSSQE